jgi:hypothetical protein
LAYYLRARPYNPAIARFLSQDPLSYNAGDTNLYRYVANEPTQRIDPMGTIDLGGGGEPPGWCGKPRCRPGDEPPGGTWLPNPPPQGPPTPPSSDCDYFECLCKCIEQHRWSNWYTGGAETANALGNACYGRYPRAGIGRPTGSPTTWQHRLCSGTQLDKVGKYGGRACVGYTIWEGFYNISAECACALICADLYPCVDKDVWVQ